MPPQLHRFRAVIAVLLCVLATAGCREPTLQSGQVHLDFSPETLDFGFVYLGGKAELSTELRNPSRGALHVSWETPSAPFSVEALPDEVVSGATELLIHFQPTEWGERTAVLVVKDGNTVLAKLNLRGVGQELPPCPTPVSCHSTRFDLERGECVEEELPDGTSCDAQSVCILNAACHSGRCVGEARSCDDQNACTSDLCNPLSGCEHVPAPPCPSAGACTVGVCDPQTGCGTELAPDGTVCGQVTCDEAEVCVAGDCVKRDPPDGFLCAPASPCQTEGVCQGSTCVQSAAAPLLPSYVFDPSTVETDATPALHDLLLEPDGALTLAGFYERPWARVNRPSSVRLDAAVRRCILWNGRLACADYIDQGSTGSVALLDLATGQKVWSFSLAGARPDFAAMTQPQHLFMARLVVMGPDRLAAIFEAYPSSTPAGNTETQCRVYFLVLLNAGGGMEYAAKIEDPMLENCDHPHPFGAAADAQGNLYLAFSPSNPGNAPLSALGPTRIFAFSHDGLPKWKHGENFVGGELAVAHGVLFPERSSLAFSAASGAPLSVGPGFELSRVVATSEEFVTGPAVSQNPRELTAWRYTGGAAWTSPLASDEAFVTGELRAMSFRSAANAEPQSALVALISKAGQLSMRAVELHTGRALWTCPLGGPAGVTPPQNFELATGTLATMDGATTCGDCDPPFALSTATFRTWTVPGLLPPNVAWSGTWGGAGHSHRETPAMVGGSSQQ